MQTVSDAIKPVVERHIKARLEKLQAAGAPDVIIKKVTAQLANPLSTVDPGYSKNTFSLVIRSIEPRKTGLVMQFQEPNDNYIVLTTHKNPKSKYMFEFKSFLPYQIGQVK